MPNGAGDQESPRADVPVVVYGGFSPCPTCGYIPREYAHMSDGHVYAYHYWRFGERDVRRMCEIQ